MVTAVTAGKLKHIGTAPSGRPSTMRTSRHRGTTVQSLPGRPPVFTRSSLRDRPRSAFPETWAACSAAYQGRSPPAGPLFHAGPCVRIVRPAISAPVKPAHRQRALPILAPLFRCRESDRPILPPPAHRRSNSRQLIYKRVRPAALRTASHVGAAANVRDGSPSAATAGRSRPGEHHGARVSAAGGHLQRR